jgi:hypothetical protein
MLIFIFGGYIFRILYASPDILMIPPTSADKIRDISFNHFAAEDSNLGSYLHQKSSKNLRTGTAHLYVKALPLDVPAIKGCQLFVS